MTFTFADTWEMQPALKRAVYSAAVCSCYDNIYVISDYMEILYSGASTWQQKTGIFPSAMSINWVLSYRRDLYMMGLYSYSLYVFDTVTEQLTELGTFKQCYMGRASSISDKIFVLGGEESQVIESYNIDKGTFAVENHLDHELLNHHVVVLPNYPKLK
jgi:hypothetical protein